ncbi:MAG TPA: isoleucine--tRNA ligase, partial [Saprospiraceae bacterium]|nr:isoleucine--tRNA ligase [Saprospiraceae bacterium]
DIASDKKLDDRWERLLQIRGEITRVLEAARRDKVIGLSLDAAVLLEAGGELGDFLAENLELIKELCIVSSLQMVDRLEKGEGMEIGMAEDVEGMTIGVRPATGAKCERCWVIEDSVGRDDEHPTLCARCCDVVRSLSS